MPVSQLAFVASVLLGLIRASTSLADVTAVGVSKVDITPSVAIRLTGYQARTQPSQGIELRLWAKAIAIGDDTQKPAILVTVDNLGVGAAIVEEVAARLEKDAGVERSRFSVASSHTHSAPCLTGVAPHIFGKPIETAEQQVIDRYTRELVDKIELVSLEALKNRKPSRLAWSQGQVDFAFNRRTKGGPTDHALPALKVTEPDGSLRAILLNYACHCTTIDPNVNKIDGDWAGYAQEAIELDHPGVIALTAIGCGADSNPKRDAKSTVDSAKANGRRIADEVNRLLRGNWKPLSAPLQTSLKRFKLDFDRLPDRSELEKLKAEGNAAGFNASVQLTKLDRGELLQAELPYSVQAWWFGDDLLMIFLPGEVVVDYVLRLKAELDPGHIWVTAYANDLPCYIPSERILKEGGYEGAGAMVYYARPTRFATGVEARIINAVKTIVPAGYIAKPK